MDAEIDAAESHDQGDQHREADQERLEAPPGLHAGQQAVRNDAGLAQRGVQLAALLRFADGFDRGHVGAVASLDVRTEGADGDARLRVTPHAARRGDALRLETWGAHRKADLLAGVLGVPVEIVSPDGTVASTAESHDAVAEPA